MTYFDDAFDKLIKNEGGYVNDPDDAGGETYMGISRKNHSKNLIWTTYIDPITKKYKKPSKINSELKANDDLTNCIKEIYKENYWDALNLDFITNKKLAFQLFDSAVNIGVSATKKLYNKILK